MCKESAAKKICQRLQDKGYLAYYAGGYVRDLILNISSDDIDIATDATPEVIQNLFEKTIPVGIAFGIIVVVLDSFSFEVATFRKDLMYKDGRRPEKISYCSPKEDALRRDFTINGMFYDPVSKEVFDYVEGKLDLSREIIRAIGDPIKRFDEDRLRMIRACRFAARFKFSIERETLCAIRLKSNDLVPAVSIERVYQELQKMKKFHFKEALYLLFELNLLQQIFPVLKGCSKENFEVSLKAIEKTPKNLPTLIHLLHLFLSLKEDSLQELIYYLKVSNEKAKLAHYFLKLRQTLAHPPTLRGWVKLYAHPQFEDIIQAVCASLSEKKAENFYNENTQRKNQLLEAVAREQSQKYVVSAQFLMEQGIEPGKKLGELLELAETIAIEQDVNDPEEILQKLHQHPLWGD